MNAKISSSKQNFFWKNCHRLKWLTLLQCGILLMTYPLNLLFSRNAPTKVIIQNGQEMIALPFLTANTFIVLIFPVLVGLLSFRYLQSTGASVSTHSMPVTRKKLMTAHFTSGLSMLFIPYFVTGFALVLVSFLVPAGTLPLRVIGIWWGSSLFFSAIFYAGTVFSGMIIGNSILQGIFVYILFLLPEGLDTLINYHLNVFLKGFTGGTTSLWTLISPMTTFINASRRLSFAGVPLTYWVIYSLLFVGFTGLSYWLYQRRQLENVGQTVQFPTLIPFLKGLGIFCGILAVGAITKELTSQNSLIFIGFLIGAVISYIVFEMLIQRNVRCQLSIQYLGLTIVLFAIVFSLFAFDVFSYGSKKIEMSEIQSVDFGMSDYKSYMWPSSQWISDPEAIAVINQLYEKSVDSVSPLFWLEKNISEKPILTFGFQNKNGKWFSRQFSLDAKLIQAELDQLYNSPAYLEHEMPYLSIEAIDIESLRVNTAVGDKTISDPLLIQPLYEALKRDIYEHPETALNDNAKPLTTIYITVPVSAKSYSHFEQYSVTSNERTQLGIYVLQNYEHTISFIQKYEAFASLLLSSDQISKILIKPLTSDSDSVNPSYSLLHSYGDFDEKDSHVTVISEPKEIDQILKAPLYMNAEKHEDYRIRYFLKSENLEALDGFLYLESVPPQFLSK